MGAWKEGNGEAKSAPKKLEADIEQVQIEEKLSTLP
jgi:hypothetical protein